MTGTSSLWHRLDHAAAVPWKKEVDAIITKDIPIIEAKIKSIPPIKTQMSDKIHNKSMQ